MTRKKTLVLQHLENISWRVLEAYPEIIRDMIRRQSGLYALYRRESLYYVGLASNLMGRLKTHLKDRHRGSWDRFSVYLTVHSDHMKELESLALRIASPRGNQQSGSFASSENLYRDLNRKIKETDEDRRARLMGGWVEKRRRWVKASKTKRGQSVVGLFDRAVRLKGWHKGYEYMATLRQDGSVRYDGRLYDTPRAAGMAALRRGCNGWTFWHYQDKNKTWVPLRTLRK